jgi:hypothetical protein
VRWRNTRKEKEAPAADTVKETVREYAHELRIPEPIKTRTTAPAGTASLLCRVSSGLQDQQRWSVKAAVGLKKMKVKNEKGQRC